MVDHTLLKINDSNKVQFILFLSLFTVLILIQTVAAQEDSLTQPYTEDQCSYCEEWNKPHPARHLYGNTYYVGTKGLSSIFIASKTGHILIDAALPNSAPLILANIRSLGFDPSDIKLMLNSHAHFDHAGGFAALQKVTGAPVAVSEESVNVIRSGVSSRNDPQHGELADMPPVSHVSIIEDRIPVQVGDTNITPIFTPGHTPGGTSWTWQECKGERCVRFVYADSLTPISSDEFLFSNSSYYPNVSEHFQQSIEVLKNISCDILITPHPGASNFWQRVETAPEGLIDVEECGEYARQSENQLQMRLIKEKNQHH